MLAAIESKRSESNVSNVETILGSADDPGWSEKSIDAALMVDADHEFSHPREMLDGLVRALRPGGVVFLVEYRAEEPDFPMLPLHKMTEAQARKELEAVGFEWVENRTFLATQHFLVFERPGGRE